MNELQTALKKLWTFLSTAFFIIIIVLGGGVIFHNVYYTPVKIVGASMEPTIRDQEFGIMDRTDFALDNIRRFQILIIKPIKNINQYIIKRVIGLPGEKVLLTTHEGQSGSLFINDNYLPQTFIPYEGYQSLTCLNSNAIACNVAITLDEYSYFVLGDNRGSSFDSRIKGPYQFSQIEGVLFAIEGTCSDSGLTTETGADLSSCSNRQFTFPRFFL
jgi:signal peptidase I